MTFFDALTFLIVIPLSLFLSMCAVGGALIVTERWLDHPPAQRHRLDIHIHHSMQWWTKPTPPVTLVQPVRPQITQQRTIAYPVTRQTEATR